MNDSLGYIFRIESPKADKRSSGAQLKMSFSRSSGPVGQLIRVMSLCVAPR